MRVCMCAIEPNWSKLRFPDASISKFLKFTITLCLERIKHHSNCAIFDYFRFEGNFDPHIDWHYGTNLCWACGQKCVYHLQKCHGCLIKLAVIVLVNYAKVCRVHFLTFMCRKNIIHTDLHGILPLHALLFIANSSQEIEQWDEETLIENHLRTETSTSQTRIFAQHESIFVIRLHLAQVTQWTQLHVEMIKHPQC